MKTTALTTIVSLAALNLGVAAIVFPEDAVIAQIPIEDTHEAEIGKSTWHLPSFQDVKDKLKNPFQHEPEAVLYGPFDTIISKAEHELEAEDHGNDEDDGFFGQFDVATWLEEGLNEQGYHQFEEMDADDEENIDESVPQYGPPDHGPLFEGPPHYGHPPGPPPPGEHLPGFPHHGHPPGPPPHYEHPPGPPPHHEHPPGPPPHHEHPPGPPPHHGPPPHKRPGKGPHKKHPPFHKHHHHKLNGTIYELISKSNFTKNFTAIIDEDKDLVSLLNSTKANSTVFVPTDWAFKKVPKDFKPPKELIKAVALYHVLPDLYPAFKLLFWHTAPTLLESKALGNNSQRVAVDWLGPFQGVRVNLFTKVIAPNLIATNGIIHAINHILLPPPPAYVILNAVPSAFSTLTLGLERTGLVEVFNYTKHPHAGGTVFAPTNRAFALLGPKINAFLFSPFGKKYLKALLEYHIVPDKTLYSTAFYNGSATSSDGSLFDFIGKVVDEVEQPQTLDEPQHHRSAWDRLFGYGKEKKHHCGKAKNKRHHHDEVEARDHHHDHDDDIGESESSFLDGFFGKKPKKPHHHHPNWTHPHHHVKFFKLPTLLKNHTLPAVIIKVGPFTKFKVNHFATVVVKDGLAGDGVIQVVNRVLIPRRHKKKADENTVEYHWDDEEVEEYGPEGMSLQEFKERMAPFIDEEEKKGTAVEQKPVEDGSKLEF